MPYTAQMSTALPNLGLFVPHKVRRKWRATKGRLRVGQSPASNVFKLQTSFSPADTIQALRTHHWSYYDFQYFGLAVLFIFCLSIAQYPSPMMKTLVATLFMISVILPVTRQFFLPFLPIAGWLLLWSSGKYVIFTYTLNALSWWEPKLASTSLITQKMNTDSLSSLQICRPCLPSSDLGPRPSGAGEHLLWRELEQYLVRTQEYRA